MTARALTDEQVAEAVALADAGWSERDLAHKFGTSKSALHRALERARRNDAQAGHTSTRSDDRQPGRPSARRNGRALQEASTAEPAPPADASEEELLKWMLRGARKHLQRTDLSPSGRAALMGATLATSKALTSLRTAKEQDDRDAEVKSARERVRAKLAHISAAMNGQRALALVPPPVEEADDAQGD